MYIFSISLTVLDKQRTHSTPRCYIRRPRTIRSRSAISFRSETSA